jgi:threonine dehydrogenase-like Zn-dependent dehydrogenase
LKAAQIVAPRKFEIVEIEKPDISHAPSGSILVKVDRSAVCGSDMPVFLSEYPKYPLEPGLSAHECVGMVAETKSDRYKEGDEVLSLPDGSRGLSEYFTSNANRTLPLPKFDRKEIILMSQPLGTVIWAFRKLGNLLDLDTVVMGQGPMGLLITHLLSNLGAKTIVAIDKLDYRLEASRKMHATHTINVDKENPVTVVREITNGKMADLVFEVVGHQTETVNQCLALVKRNGTILTFGVPDHDIYPFQFRTLFNKNVTLIGSVGPDVQRDFPLAIDMIAQGRINVEPMITHIIPLAEVQRGFDMAYHKTDNAIKVVFNHDG